MFPLTESLISQNGLILLSVSIATIQAVGHGDGPSTENYCRQCHSPEATASGLIFGPFHLDPSLKNQPLVFSIEVLNILILLGVFGALVFWIVRGVKGDTKRTQQPGG